MTQEELADQIIVKLNEILNTDLIAVELIIEHRVDCNDALKAHPTVQTSNGQVGFLGILNGLIGTIQQGPRQGWGLITGVYDDGGRLIRFERTKENP